MIAFCSLPCPLSSRWCASLAERFFLPLSAFCSFRTVLGGGLNYHPFNPAELNRTVRMDILASMIIIPSTLENVKWNRKVFRAYYPARTSASLHKNESPLTIVSPTARHLPRSLSLLPCIQSGPRECCTGKRKISEKNPFRLPRVGSGGIGENRIGL